MATDIQLLRDLLEDPLAVTFSDTEIGAFITRAADPLQPTAALTMDRLYYAAFLGWLRKAGKIKVKNQTISIFRKNTEGAYKAAIVQAHEYLDLSNSTSTIGLTTQALIPGGLRSDVIDTRTPMVDTSVDGTDARPVNGLAEVW